MRKFDLAAVHTMRSDYDLIMPRLHWRFGIYTGFAWILLYLRNVGFIAVLKPSQCGAMAVRRTELRGPGFETRLVFPKARKLFGTARWHSSLGMLIGPSPHHCSPIGRAPVQLTVKTSTWCLQ